MFPSLTGYMLTIFWSIFTELGVYSMDSSKLMGNFPEVLNANRLFLKLNQYIY